MNDVSIAICTYNGEKYLAEQLNTFTQQTLSPYEIVLCDDKSTDATLDIAYSFQQQSSIKMKIFRNDEKLGFVKNFEKAISLCTGDFIALSDQDDVWVRDKLETLVNEFKKQGNEHVSVIFTDLELVDENLAPLNKTVWRSLELHKMLREQFSKKGYFQTLKDNGNFVTGASVMMRKRIVSKLIPFVDKAKNWYHDGQIALIAAKNNELMFLDKPLVLYRQHQGQTLGIKDFSLPPILSVILKHIAEKKKADLFYFDKIDVIKIWDKGERENLVKEIAFLEKRVSILSKKVINRIIPVGIQFFAMNYLRFRGKLFLRTVVNDFLNH